MNRSIPRTAVLVCGLLVFLVALLSRRSQAGVEEPVGSSGLELSGLALETLATRIGPLTSIAQAGDTRLFLTLQTGRTLVYDGTRVLSSPFLDITPLVSCCGERGLLSVAFHPQYRENGFFFVNYTNTSGDSVIARYRVSAADPNAADRTSGVILLTVAQPFANHNGGELQFGPDGYLYIGMGDGGSANDPGCRAQRDETLLGKMLRIDVNQNVKVPPYYGIPPDNPFVGLADPPDEVWAKGLRNPWRYCFDRVTGDLFIGDVGQNAREEIDFQPASSRGGENYGWKMMEGTLCGSGGTSGCPAGVPRCNDAVLKPPILEYAHGSGECSVTGGHIYRGGLIPPLYGVYVYGDYCSGRIWGATESRGSWTAQLLALSARLLTTFGEDAAGEIYLGTEDGNFYRLVSTQLFSPELASITPSSGSARGGTVVTLTGSNFVAGATVSFGEVPAAEASVLNPTTVSAVTGTGGAGVVSVVVTNPGGRSAALANSYTYLAPVRAAEPRPTPRAIQRRE